MAAAGAVVAGGAGGSSTDRIKKATQVSAVADARIQAVIVTAPKDLMEEIASMMKDLDVASDRDQDVYVFKMNNGDPQQALTVLQSMFQSSSARSSSSSSSAEQRADATAAKQCDDHQFIQFHQRLSARAGGGGGGRAGGFGN